MPKKISNGWWYDNKDPRELARCDCGSLLWLLQGGYIKCYACQHEEKL